MNMKFKRRLTWFLLLGALSFGPGCEKSKHTNPCEDVVSEGTPTQVGLIFLNGQTGENILLSKDIDTSTITITSEATNAPSERGVIVKAAGSPIYGALVFHVADTKKGAFKYKINIPNVGTTTLSYTNQEESSNNPCNPHYIVVTDPVIGDHQFTLSRTGSRLVFKVPL
jgi:hypothetical protein